MSSSELVRDYFEREAQRFDAIYKSVSRSASVPSNAI